MKTMKGMMVKKSMLTLFLLLLICAPCLSTLTGSNHMVYGTSVDDQFDEELTHLMNRLHLPSLVLCVIKNNSISFLKSYGYTNIMTKDMATTGTSYLVGSISKTITATALLQLYEQGFFDLDDDINEYLPYCLRNPHFPEVNITFRMILSHQASLNDFGIRPSAISYILTGARTGMSYSMLCKELLVPDGSYYNKWYWINAPPGKVSQYSELDIIIAGSLVEILSNQSLETYCQKHIFQPLNMTHTSFSINNIDPETIATPHFLLGSKIIPFPIYEYFFLDPPAGLWTTTEDLAHFFIAHLNNGSYRNVQILGEDTIKQMHTIHYPQYSDRLFQIIFKGQFNVQHGLGWEYIDIQGTTIEGHTGGTPGYNCHMYAIEYEEDKQVSALFLSNGPFFSPALLATTSTVSDYLSLIDLIIEKSESL